MKTVLAHRGYWEIAPENTKLSFELAYLFGFEGVELDVHKTKDDKLVVIHDETVNRTSNGKGYVKNLTLAQIRKFDFGKKFSIKTPFQKIMTYEEFLKKFGNKFKYINVEIKTDIVHYKNIEKSILNISNKVRHKAEIIYSSFNFESLKILRSLSKEAQIGFLCVNKEDVLAVENLVPKVCNYLHPWFKTLLNKKDLDYFNKFNLPLSIWTVDKRNVGDIWSDDSFNKLEKLNKIKKLKFIISNSSI